MAAADKDKRTLSSIDFTVIDDTVASCLPITQKQKQTFADAIRLADGIKTLRDLFLNDKRIIDMVTAMQDTPLGFLTDRSPSQIAAAERKGKKLYPYKYPVIAEACIEALLKGYHLTDNEFNVISNRFYPAKNGKFRIVNEWPGVSDFQYTNTAPIYVTEQKGREQVMYAKVQCFASWKQNGTIVKLGHEEYDKQIYKIAAYDSTGDDAVVGKAKSKLLSRVLERISGKPTPDLELDYSQASAQAEVEQNANSEKIDIDTDLATVPEPTNDHPPYEPSEEEQAEIHKREMEEASAGPGF